MAHHKSAIKRIKQSNKRRIYNRQHKKAVKYAIRDVREATNFEVAWEKFKLATKVLDRAAAQGVVHKNNAARRKSRLAKFVGKLRNVEA